MKIDLHLNLVMNNKIKIRTECFIMNIDNHYIMLNMCNKNCDNDYFLKYFNKLIEKNWKEHSLLSTLTLFYTSRTIFNRFL
jgi:hypothetical protein